MRFWDSSALVPIGVSERHTSAMRALAESDQGMIVWWGAVVECWAALARRRREGGLDDADDARAGRAFAGLFTAAAEVPPTARVREIARRLVRVHPLRAADALHLAAALVWAEQSPASREFVTLDDRLRQAAAREGFTVLP